MRVSSFTLRRDPYPSNAALNALAKAAWGPAAAERDYRPVLERALTHFGAYDGDRLIGFVNVAWDGGAHAFLLDTMVHPQARRCGVGRKLVECAIEQTRSRGVEWIHVDHEPHLKRFYESCGFRPTMAGLIHLED